MIFLCAALINVSLFVYRVFVSRFLFCLSATRSLVCAETVYFSVLFVSVTGFDGQDPHQQPAAGRGRL